MTDKRTVFYINERKQTAGNELAHLLKKCIDGIERPWDEIVLLCIGSDRITGDSLGPLIGHRLSRCGWKKIHVLGTLQHPVHALNLKQTLEQIKKRHPTALIIAVDASLGSRKHVGYISVGIGSICPGAGVQKDLPPVGDLFITGILNPSGSFEHLLLQTTRLSLVVQMAETIVSGILRTFYDLSVNPASLLPWELWQKPDAEPMPSVFPSVFSQEPANNVLRFPGNHNICP